MQFQKIMFVLLLLFVSSTFCFSQKNNDAKNTSGTKHIIGVQYNPYINTKSFSFPYPKQYTYAIRYGYRTSPNISFGSEISGNYLKNEIATSTSFNMGVFIRASSLVQKSISPFAELSAYYQIGKTIITDASLILDSEDTFNNNQFNYYFAPGLSINLYKKRLTLDVMVKVSTIKFFFGNNITPAYKLQFYF